MLILFGGCPEDSIETGMGWWKLDWLVYHDCWPWERLTVKGPVCHSGDPKTSLTLIFQIVRGRLKPLADKYWPCYENSFRSMTFVTSYHPSLIPPPQYLTHLLTHLFVSFRVMKKVRSQVTF